MKDTNHRVLYRHLAHHYGFTLVELMAILVIVGILATTALIRFTPGDVNLQITKNQTMAALVFARETAMARSDGSVVITVVVSEQGVDVRSNGTSIHNLDQRYPLTFENNVSLTSEHSVLTFNALGEVEETVIRLTEKEQSVEITISGAGYAY